MIENKDTNRFWQIGVFSPIHSQYRGALKNKRLATEKNKRSEPAALSLVSKSLPPIHPLTFWKHHLLWGSMKTSENFLSKNFTLDPTHPGWPDSNRAWSQQRSKCLKQQSIGVLWFSRGMWVGQMEEMFFNWKDGITNYHLSWLNQKPGLLENRIFNSSCLLEALFFRRLFLWNLATKRCQKPCTSRPTQQCLLRGPVPHKYYMRCKQLALPAFDPLRGTMVVFSDGRISMNRVQDARPFMGQPPCLLVQDFSITGYDSVPL